MIGKDTKKSRNRGKTAWNNNGDQSSVTSVSSMGSHGLTAHTVGGTRKHSVLASNYARLERLLRKTAKEDEDLVDYKKLMRTETQIERLKRKKEEKDGMDQRERIERDIICTDPSEYVNKVTEAQKIELHMVNEAFVRAGRRNRKAFTSA